MKAAFGMMTGLILCADALSGQTSDARIALQRLDDLYETMRASEAMHIDMQIDAVSSTGESLPGFPLMYSIDVCGTQLSYRSGAFAMVQSNRESLQVHHADRQLVYRHLGETATTEDQRTVEELLPVSVKEWAQLCDSIVVQRTTTGDHVLTFHYPYGPWITASLAVDADFTKLLRLDAVGRDQKSTIAHYIVEYIGFKFSCTAGSKTFDLSRFIVDEGLTARPSRAYASYDFVNLTPR